MDKKDEKEMSLLELIKSFFNWLKKIGLGLLNLLGEVTRLLFRHKILTSIILILCILCGLYLSRHSVRRYEADAMAILNGSLAQTVKEVSSQLETASPLSNSSTLSAKLSLPDSITRNILEIKSFYVIDFLNDSTPDVVDFKHKHDLTDTINIRMHNRLYFRIKTKNVSQLPVFESAFVNYFNTNDRLQYEFQTKKANLAKKIELTDAEINRLDSLAKFSYFRNSDLQLQMAYNRLYVGDQRKQLFYEDMLGLQNQLLKDEIEFVNFTEPVVLPTGFVVNPQAKNNRTKCLLISISIGVALSILLSLMVENRKRIFSYLSKK
ncbi:hypothetical protein D0T49_05165 [Paludibacter sp. 221]|uniref:hypothetical protein n=1 Tax=Paludibacter sp. 221 TaxID=2302939 RepID=UPI0013D5C7FD|nr:hypothetical protein [Paludibacter sp. 221]NDV46429.1 hypothetical protein [Paludibacter sp. 221]